MRMVLDLEKDMRNCILFLLITGILLPSMSFATDAPETPAPQELRARQLITNQLKPGRLPARDDADEVVYEEDFEDGADDWTTSDLQSPAWHKSDWNERGDGDLLWWCGDTLTGYAGPPVGYDNNWLEYLDTPVLDFSEAGNGLKLEMDAWWLLEDPRPHPPPDGWDGWDGFLVMISEDAGETFDVLYPDFPEYTANHLSAADRYWNIGDLPGWAFYSTEGEWADSNEAERPNVEWVDCEFDLFAYRVEDVVIRFILVSDRAVAAPFDNPYLVDSGVCIDNLLITDDEDEIYFYNGADDDPYPEEMIALLDPKFSGDYWELTNSSSHSGDWAMWNDDDHFNAFNALDSPPIQLPEADNIWFQFWVYCNLPDWDSDGSGNLDEDFYRIYLSADAGESWEYQTHDYYRDGAGNNQWAEYVPGIPFEGNTELDIADYADSTIQLRWMFYTDRDDDGGDGEGLFIDDLQILSANLQRWDTGMENFYAPYPTTVGLRLEDISVDCFNNGMEAVDRLPSRWGYKATGSSLNLPINPRPSLESEEVATIVISDYSDRQYPGWIPVSAGNYKLWAATDLDNDGDTSNDTARTEMLHVNPIGLYELGYDGRRAVNFYSFDQGFGPATRFSPDSLEIAEYSLSSVRFLFNELAEQVSFTLHIFGNGDADSPGDRLLQMDVDVPADSSFPNHMTVELFEEADLRSLSGDFWVWVELTRDDGLPQITGEDTQFGAGHYFNYDDNNAVDYESDLLMHATIIPGEPTDPDLGVTIGQLDFGEVYIDEGTSTLFSLWAVGLVPVTITDVTVNNDVYELDWQGETTIVPGEAATFTITFNPPADSEYMGVVSIESDDTLAPLIILNGVGLGVEENRYTIPDEFGLQEVYPNPFNNVTRVEFAIQQAGHTTLKLFDLSGREVSSLLDSRLPAGKHTSVIVADQIPAGVYMLQLQTENMRSSMKVALVK